MKVFKYILLGVNILFVLAGMYIAFTYADAGALRNIILIFTAAFLVLNCGNYYYFRKRFIGFTNEICKSTEKILQGESIRELQNQETLTSKIVTELEKVENILKYQYAESEKEKSELQGMISEITHQIKTPVSNIQMYHEMLLSPDTTTAEAQEFLRIIQQQLGRLEFLLETLIKASRLENDMIQLEMENSRIVDTLAVAVNNVIQKAEKKKIDILVECRTSIQVMHDTKWTAEAVENLLDNAIKYTPKNGKIELSVAAGEMYTEIKVKDNGKGIEAAHINDIFKRFYREKDVSKTEGLGLGLYLTRTIIVSQGGYVTVHSSPGKGSCFTICLPNHISI